MTTKKEKELKIKLWFAEHELYSDGSNVDSWLPLLKERLEEIFEINLLKEGERI